MSTDDPLAATIASDSEPASSLSGDPSAPKTIGRFEIVAKLGEGGMGVVWLATDPDLGRRVALKMLRGDEKDPDRRDRFMREARAAAKLTHDNIIVVHEVGTTDNRVYVAMEHVAGCTLGAWQRTPRTWSAIVEMYIRAGRGLHAAHIAGLVHRDFKPDNVLIGDDGRVRVTDFGLVAAVGAAATAASSSNTPDDAEGSLTRTGAVLGTPRYMAPEQHLSKPLDPRADQFSFCVALYEALYGRPPFAGTTHAQIVASVCAGELAPVPKETTVPPAIRDAIVRGLATDREKRYPSMEELIGELSPKPVRMRRRRWIWIVVGVVVAALLADGVYLYKTSVDEREQFEAERRATAAKQARSIEDQKRELDEERRRNEVEKEKLANEAKALRERAESLDREIVSLKMKIEMPGPKITHAVRVDVPGHTSSGSATKPAAPDSLKASQEHFDAAQAAFTSGRYDTAIVEFQAAYAARPFPQFLYNVGAAYHMKAKRTMSAADYGQAIAFYKRYLIEDPKASDKAKIEKMIEKLEDVLKAK